MESQLFTLSKIFTERLFRIPDYQRGYAWTEPQLKDFWNDLLQIENGQNHYTGVLTLEDVPPDELSGWQDDRWIIDAKGYSPFYVVDGQQRLTTSIILLQTIYERIPDGGQLNYTDKSDIRRKFIFDSKDGGISRSYIFGYDKDNPSYEFLKTRIFDEFSSGSEGQETIYTNNLEKAKAFFSAKLSEDNSPPINVIYKKLTQNLLFNIFSISDEVEVCVAFETMNNRGKPLSYLELLKNRLIYLSLKLDQHELEKQKLRRSINDCWKAIYHRLGKNKNRPLEDDLFLNSHYLLYFLDYIDEAEHTDEGYERAMYVQRRFLRQQDHYSRLLEEIFVTKSLAKEADISVDINYIYDYVTSLQDAVFHWFDIFNARVSDRPSEEATWLDKIDRLDNRPYLPFILAVLAKVKTSESRTQILQRLERLMFVNSIVDHTSSRRLFAITFNRMAIGLFQDKITVQYVLTELRDISKGIVESKSFLSDFSATFKSRGFYNWRAIRYFLFEYNLHLQERSKTERKKIDWEEYSEKRQDYHTIEHIYPQNARAKYWTSRFSGLMPKQRDVLRNSLGNLLPLSQPKNSSLSNRPFPDKVSGGTSSVGFRYGSYAENEVSENLEWRPEEIKRRGVKLLTFMEKRWGLKLGTEKDKIEALGLEFLDR